MTAPTAEPTTGMDFKVLSENFENALAIVGRAISKRYASLPITSNVRIRTCGTGRLRFDATDMDMSITTYIGARVEAAGATTVPAKLALDLAKSAKNSVLTIATLGRNMQVKVGEAGERNLSTIPAEDFPEIPIVEDGVKFIFDPRALEAGINRVEKAAAHDETRPVLTGIHLSVGRNGPRVRLAAADGFRLAFADVEVESELGGLEDYQVIIPARAMREVARLAKKSQEPVELRVNGKSTHASFSWRDTVLTTGVIQGTYPSYGQLTLAEEKILCSLTVNADALAPELKGAAAVAKDGSGIVRFEVTPTGWRVSAMADQVGEFVGTVPYADLVEGDGFGTANKIAFNARYIQDMAAAFKGSDIRCHFAGPSQQGMFVSPDGCFTYVIMPMFVQW